MFVMPTPESEPRPRISARPRLCSVDVEPAPAWRFGSALDLPHRLWLTSGRAAIALALQHADLAAGDEVLLPAYACRSMVEPVEFLGLTPTYYALDGDLRLTIDELERRRTPSTRAVLIARYHGFPCESIGLDDYCCEHRIVVIEDRAHAFFGPTADYADYVIYSATKFFPVFEGGLLASRREPVEEIRTTAAPAAFQLKSALWPHEYASDYDAHTPRNFLMTGALWLKEKLKPAKAAGQAGNGSATGGIGPAAADGGAGLEPYWINKSMSWSSRRAILEADLDWIAARRRHNWERLVRSLCKVNGLRMIHPSLDRDVVPYAAAFVVPNPEATARQLRDGGVPLYRWDSFALDTMDPTLRETVDLSHNILQIPTHQAMNDEDIDRIADSVSRAVACSKPDR